jgi:hypothetical protein
MALVSLPTIVDDLDASTEGVGTYTFALQGVTYEIDLSAPNADQLFELLNPYIQAGRRLPKNATTAKRNRKGGKNAEGTGATGRAAKGAVRAGAAAADKPTSSGTRTRRRRSTSRSVSEPTAPEIRNWWAEKAQALGLPTFRSRGAIPGQVRNAYATAHS